MRKTRTIIALLLTAIVIYQISSCKKSKKDTTTYVYSGTGDGNIDSTKKANITVVIQSNLNVNGSAQIGTNAVVKNDVNLNKIGRVVFLANKSTDTIYIDGNLNCNDTLLVQRGILNVKHDFNINTSGVVNCSNDAQIVINGSLNQAGTLWGIDNIKAKTKNINNPKQTFNNPIPYYTSSAHY